MANVVFVPEKIISAHSIDRCEDCIWFNEWGGAYGDAHACGHIGGPIDPVQRDDIPDECPLLVDHCI